MLKGYYVHFEARRWTGVARKIDMQLHELKKHFEIEEIAVAQNNRSLIRKVYDAIPFVMGKKHNFKEAYRRIDHPDFVYVRGTWSDNQYMSFFRTLREKYPLCKIVVEIPTYPYDKMVEKCLYPRDLWSRRKYKYYVDRIITYSEDDIIFGVPAIRVRNGIDVDAVTVAGVNETSSEIHLIAVASLLPGHGYERCIQGLKNYYDTSDEDMKIIKLHIVGEGPELKHYKELVTEYDLGQYVFFYGKKINKELDDIYEAKDIAMGCFGDYKVGIYKSSALKTREYLAKGLPIISADREDVFDDTPEYPYYLQVPNDATAIDFNSVVTFYNKIYNGEKKEDVHYRIRKFAKQHIEMAVVMKPIIEYLEDTL